MEIGIVSTGSIIGIIFSLVLAVGIPILLCIVMRVKEKADLSSFFIGCGTFVLAAMILEQMLHAVVITLAGETLTGNIFLYGLYGGIAAAVFEETGRFIAMKYVMKNRLNRKNALMYGVGHGGAEAILLIGLTYLSNLMTAFMINNGQLQASLDVLNDTQKEATLQSLSTLWTSPSYLFYMSGVERVFAIALQIAFSVLMYKAVKLGEKKYILLAMGTHFFIDFVSVIASNYLPIWIVELILLLMTVAMVYYTYRLYREDESTEMIA